MPRIVKLGHVDQPFDSFVQLDERSEVGHAHDLALDRVAHVMTAEEVVPDIRRQLLQAERQPLVLGVDVEHHRIDDVALLQHFRRVLDPLAPRHVGDMNQAVDLFLDLDERAELGEVTNLALDSRTDGVLVRQVVPRVALDLFQTKRNASSRRIDSQHHRVDVVADIQNLRRVLDALAPRHLGNVNQPLDARLELDERSVIGEADHFAFNTGADWIPLHHVRPWIGNQLLVSQRHAFGGRVVLEHDHVDLVVHLEQFRGVADATPGHVGDVQQTVDAAEVDESTVVGDVLHDALEHFAFGQRLERVLLLFGVLLLEERLAGQHDIAPLLVDLDHAHAQLLTAQRVEVANRTDVDLRPGQERAHADVHGET